MDPKQIKASNQSNQSKQAIKASNQSKQSKQAIKANNQSKQSKQAIKASDETSDQSKESTQANAMGSQAKTIGPQLVIPHRRPETPLHDTPSPSSRQCMLRRLRRSSQDPPVGALRRSRKVLNKNSATPPQASREAAEFFSRLCSGGRRRRVF